MKTPVKILLFLSGLMIITACRKDDSPGEPFKQDYFECKINGKFFEAKSEDQCRSLNVYYSQLGSDNVNPGYFVMSGANCTPGEYKRVGVKIFNLNPYHKGYRLPIDSISAYHQTELLGQAVDSTIEGEVEFSILKAKQFDQDGKKISNAEVEGTFHFTLARPDGTTIEITEGRFGFFNI